MKKSILKDIITDKSLYIALCEVLKLDLVWTFTMKRLLNGNVGFIVKLTSKGIPSSISFDTFMVCAPRSVPLK